MSNSDMLTEIDKEEHAEKGIKRDKDAHTLYLKENPDFLFEFLASNPDVLASINLSSKNSDASVSSLVQKQVDVLRERKANSDAKLIEFVSNASENDRLLSQTRSYVLAIMRSPSRKALLETIAEQFGDRFDVEFNSIELIGEQETNAKQEFLTSSGQLQLFSGMIRETESQTLFDQDQAQSALVIMRKLNDGKALLIAIGSENPNFYFPEIGTELIEFLTDCAAEMMNNLS